MLLSRFREVLRVLQVAQAAEGLRLEAPPRDALRRARAKGRLAPRRSSAEKAFMRTAVRLVDGAFPDRGNCYRRVLMTCMVDPDAAATPVVFGLSPTLAPDSGHAWLEGEEVPTSYPLRIQL